MQSEINKHWFLLFLLLMLVLFCFVLFELVQIDTAYPKTYTGKRQNDMEKEPIFVGGR